MIWTFLALGVLLPALGFLFWHRAYRRRQRIRLRLLNGQVHLLGDEITASSQDLLDCEDDELTAACVGAETALDELNVALLDRQAQLQNYEELASLQRHKIAILERTLTQPSADVDVSQDPPEPATPRQDADTARRPAPRGEIEQSLLSKIEETHKRHTSGD